MLIDNLLMNIQMSFSNKDHFGIDLITKVYNKYPEKILKIPVSYSGYGFGQGKKGTFKERLDRFVKLISTNKDQFKAMYSTNTDNIATLLYLYDVGRCSLSEDKIKDSEQNHHRTICGQTVVDVQEQVMRMGIYDKAGMLITNIPQIYNSMTDNGVKNTEVTLATQLILLDKLSIESLKFGFK
jgi:hypothetical protein